MKVKEIFMYVLGGLITIGFFATLIYLISKGGSESTVNLLVGSLIGSFGLVVGYFYGSSKGSADKNELLVGKKNEN